MVKIFRHLPKSYSIKSEAEIHGCTIKKLFWRILKISQKKPMNEPLFKQRCRLTSWFFLKKAPAHVFSCKLCQIFLRTFLAKDAQVTASAKYPFVFHVNLSHKMLPLILFFPFYFKYFQSKHFSSKSPKQLAMTM